MTNMIQFEPKQELPFIKVIGVGGGGSNAVNHMFKQGIKGVEFAVCNTDTQALSDSPVPNKIRIGDTDGLGAGSKPNVGEDAAKGSIELLKGTFSENIKMVFITAGMGGGTGTGAAPIIAELAQELGILTVGIVTLPFSWEGRRRKQQAEAGIDSLRKYVDTLLVINNDKLREQYGNLPIREAFAKADNVLSTSARGIAEIITVSDYVNTDFEDVKTVIQGSGKAIMGSGVAEGENRAMTAIEEAMNSPLLNDNDIKGAQNILLHIVTGTDEITMDEITEITEYVQSESGNEADLIWGQGHEESLENKIRITLIATGFHSKKKDPEPSKPKKVYDLSSNKSETVTTEKKTISPEAELIESPTTEEEKPVGDFMRITKRDEPNGIEEADKSTQFTLSLDKETITSEHTKDGKQSESDDKSSSDQKDDDAIDKVKPPYFEKISRQTPDQSHLSIQRTVNDYSIENPIEKEQLREYDENINKKGRERAKRLSDLSWLKKDKDISKLESEPAYKRKEIEIDNTPPSTKSSVSRFTLGDDSKNNPVIKSDNSFLHDNVD